MYNYHLSIKIFFKASTLLIATILMASTPCLSRLRTYPSVLTSWPVPGHDSEEFLPQSSDSVRFTHHSKMAAAQWLALYFNTRKQ